MLYFHGNPPNRLLEISASYVPLVLLFFHIEGTRPVFATGGFSSDHSKMKDIARLLFFVCLFVLVLNLAQTDHGRC